MTERQKRIAIILAVIVIALLLLLTSKGGATTVVRNSGDMPELTNLSSPNIVINGRRPFILPDFASRGGNDFSVIGACCADCRPARQSFRGEAPPQYLFVTNMANRGPTIYNNVTTVAQPPKPMLRVGGYSTVTYR